jgi:hypothetical protein
MHWTEKYLGGHIAFYFFYWRIAIYGFNAMHVAINIKTVKFGYVCFHPPMKCFGQWWPWYFYVSPNATPWASTFAIGPGVGNVQKALSKQRRDQFGHNFDDYFHHDEMMEMKDREEKRQWDIIKARLGDA